MATFFFKGGRAAVAYGHCGVAMLFLEHQLSHGLANDVAAAQNHTFLSRCGNFIAFEQCDNAKGCGRNKTGQAQCHATCIHWVNTVNILVVINGIDHLLLVNVLGQRQLNDEAVNIGIIVQSANAVEKLFLGSILVHADERRLEPAFLAGNHLVFHIGLRATVMANQHSGQMGALLSCFYHLLHLGLDFVLDGIGSFLSVYQFHAN